MEPAVAGRVTDAAADPALERCPLGRGERGWRPSEPRHDLCRRISLRYDRVGAGSGCSDNRGGPARDPRLWARGRCSYPLSRSRLGCAGCCCCCCRCAVARPGISSPCGSIFRREPPPPGPRGRVIGRGAARMALEAAQRATPRVDLLLVRVGAGVELEIAADSEAGCWTLGRGERLARGCARRSLLLVSLLAAD